MELHKISLKIEETIAEIEAVRKAIKPRGEALAHAQVDYDYAIAKKILEMRENYPVTIVEKLARGECITERRALTVAESGYKSCTTNLQALMAILNAYQSLNRHQQEL